MGVCLFLCCLILFFLFPRSITLTPVSVVSVMVYFNPDTVSIEVINCINISNANFVPVQIADFTIQGVVYDSVVGKNTTTNMTALQPRSQKSYNYQVDMSIKDKGLINYCKSQSVKIHTIFVALQITLNISYLAHTEQLSLETYEYIDCGNNSTVPHPVRSQYKTMDTWHRSAHD